MLCRCVLMVFLDRCIVVVVLWVDMGDVMMCRMLSLWIVSVLMIRFGIFWLFLLWGVVLVRGLFS